MPKKKSEESQKDQSKRFDAEVQRLIDAGELNPTEADELFDLAVRRITSKQVMESQESADSSEHKTP